MERLDAATDQVMRDGTIGGEHEFFNEAVRDVAFAAGDGGDLLVLVELDDGGGKIEVDGAIFAAASVEEQSEFAHIAKIVRQRGVTLVGGGIALQNFVHVGVGHALGGTDYALHHAGAGDVACGIELHERAHDQAVFARIQRADAAGKRFGKHGNGAIDEVHGVAAEASFAVERSLGANVVSDVGDVDLQLPAAVAAAFDVHGIVEIARGFAVDGDDGEIAEVLAACAVGIGDGKREAFGFLQNILGKNVRKMMLANNDFGVDAEIAGTSKNFDDAAGGRRTAAGKANEFDI